jgi:hypothetical protein
MLNDRKRRVDFFIASAMLASGLMLTGYSMVSVASTTRVHLAQATPPVQSEPAPADNDKPAESKPGGTRPTTPAPEPARPDTQARQEGAKAALPPAPAEKMSPPIQSKQ